MKPIIVQEGEIAAWFGERGGGIQYMLPETIEDLLAQGVIQRRDNYDN